MLEGEIDRGDRPHVGEKDQRLRDGRRVAKRSRLRADLRLLLMMLVAWRQRRIVLRLTGKAMQFATHWPLNRARAMVNRMASFEREAHSDIIADATRAQQTGIGDSTN